MSRRRLATLISLAALAGVLSFVAILLLWPRSEDQPPPNSSREQASGASYSRLTAASVAGADSAHRWSAEVPVGWKAEAVAGSQAINLYDPVAPGSDNLAKSQVFVRYFRGNGFLTLSTVTVHERSETKVAGRPAVRYVIEKKASVLDFLDQPKWRSGRHEVTDVRSTEESPTVFYVVAKRPELSDEIYAHLLETFQPVAELGLGGPAQPQLYG